MHIFNPCVSFNVSKFKTFVKFTGLSVPSQNKTCMGCTSHSSVIDTCRENVMDTRSMAVHHAMFRKGALKCADSNVKCPKTNGVEDCNNWFNKGVCHQDCPRAASHIRLQGAGLSSWKTYSKKVAEKVASLSAST